MLHNPVIETMMNRASVRIYTDQEPADEVVETVVRVGQQAPFAYQMGSLLLSRDSAHNPFRAPLYFIICMDSSHEVMMRRGWEVVRTIFVAPLRHSGRDADGRSHGHCRGKSGLGSCFLGGIPYRADRIVEQYKLPGRAFPSWG